MACLSGTAAAFAIVESEASSARNCMSPATGSLAVVDVSNAKFTTRPKRNPSVEMLRGWQSDAQFHHRQHRYHGSVPRRVRASAGRLAPPRNKALRVCLVASALDVQQDLVESTGRAQVIALLS